MVNLNHENIEFIIKKLKGDMINVRERIDELYFLQRDNQDNIAPPVNDAINELLEAYDDLNDCIEEVREAIEDCED